MTDNIAIRFDDGAAYERYMGVWSQLAGQTFMSWLAPQPGLRWLDVGCGNGAFTELLANHAAARSVHGIDPSPEQLAFARTRPSTRAAQYDQGDAMALPYAADSFDLAVMPLVIFFVPDPSLGVAEMVRVTSPGGTVAAYAWDMMGAGFPYHALQAEMRAMGLVLPTPPSPDASRLEALRGLWEAAGLAEVDTRTIEVQRTFADFEDYWATVQGGPSMAGRLKAMSTQDATRLQERMRAVLPADGAGRIICGARAHAVKGRVRDRP